MCQCITFWKITTVDAVNTLSPNQLQVKINSLVVDRFLAVLVLAIDSCGDWGDWVWFFDYFAAGIDGSGIFCLA
jgi:hypothetical protein